MKKEFIININKIKSKYDCKGEVIFRSALCLLLDYGKERCGNMDWVNDNKELTKKNHKEAEEQGKARFNEHLGFEQADPEKGTTKPVEDKEE